MHLLILDNGYENFWSFPQKTEINSVVSFVNLLKVVRYEKWNEVFFVPNAINYRF